MSAWLQSGRSSIQNAVEDAFKKIDEHTQAEIRERDRRNNELLRELQQLKDRAANALHLQNENELLRKQLQRLIQSQNDRNSISPKRRSVLAELSPNKLANDRAEKPEGRSNDKPLDFEKEYNKLRVKYNGLVKSREEYKSVLRQRVEQIEKWAEASDKQKAIIERLRKRLAQYQSEATGTSEARSNGASIHVPAANQYSDIVLEESERPSPNSSAQHHINEVPETSIVPAVADCAVSEEANGSVIPGLAIEHDTADGSHQDVPVNEPTELPSLPGNRGGDSRITMKVELSSDGPLFISERPVRKRKSDQEESRTKKPQRIKSEHSSLGPECTGEAPLFEVTEGFDFEEDIHVPTPRKRKDLMPDQQHTLAEGLPGLTGAVTPMYNTHTPSATTEALFTPAAYTANLQTKNRSSVLLEATAHLLRPAPPGEQRPQSSTPSLLDVSGFVEDPDANSSIVQHTVFKGRLHTRLNLPSVRATKTNTRRSLRKMQIPRPTPVDDYEDALKVPAPRELPHGKQLPPREETLSPAQREKIAGTPRTKSSLVRDQAPKRPSTLRDDMLRGRPAEKEKAPLRYRSMDKLRPEDFKPNPKYNDGLTYVYDEVVRGREARSTLSGCTDPNCCGKTFRSFAQAERSSIGSSVTTRAEDIKLLEDYLGDEMYKLSTMTRDEKEETWLLAKTRELAQKFGRHRQRYARIPSPPGFWTVEFPSTQERAEERRQAEEISRALVHERYREAMRSGGRWVFRDEDGR